MDLTLSSKDIFALMVNALVNLSYEETLKFHESQCSEIHINDKEVVECVRRSCIEICNAKVDQLGL